MPAAFNLQPAPRPAAADAVPWPRGRTMYRCCPPTSLTLTSDATQSSRPITRTASSVAGSMHCQLDGAGNGASRAVHLRALGAGPVGEEAASRLLAITQHDLAVGADVDQRGDVIAVMGSSAMMAATLSAPT